ncbi:MAG: right-handed parallel beta-helix repeat-containing protein, partial [Thermoplasmatota archaeon]
MGPRSNYQMGSRSVLLTILLMISVASVLWLPDEIQPMIHADGALTSITPIVIEKDNDLGAHPSVRSGSGTTLDPYVISDYSIDSTASGRYGIAIRNTTANLIMRNLTIRVSGSSIGIYLRSYSWNSQNIVMKNITIIGGSYQVYLYIPVRVTISDCTFSNPSATGKVVYSYYGSEVLISNNTFNTPNMEMDLDYSSSVTFNLNRGTIHSYDHLRFRYSNFANNSLSLYSVYLWSGYYSDFQGNELISRDGTYNLLTIV